MRISGAHINSARTVAFGEADIAGIDAVSWRHMTTFDPWVDGLRVLGWTDPSPGLPFITAYKALAPTPGRCIARAIRSMPDDLRARLTLNGLVRIDAVHYLSVSDPANMEATNSFRRKRRGVSSGGG